VEIKKRRPKARKATLHSVEQLFNAFIVDFIHQCEYLPRESGQNIRNGFRPLLAALQNIFLTASTQRQPEIFFHIPSNFI
jgi:hypothetical protein